MLAEAAEWFLRCALGVGEEVGAGEAVERAATGREEAGGVAGLWTFEEVVGVTDRSASRESSFCLSVEGVRVEDEAIGVGCPLSVSPEAVEVLDAEEGRVRSGSEVGEDSRSGDAPGSDIDHLNRGRVLELVTTISRS